MYYDKRFEQQTEAKPDLEYQGVSLRNLIAWLEQQPKDCEYVYVHPMECLLGQYLKSTGKLGLDRVVSFKVSHVLGKFWLRHIVADGELTFGAALDRARKIAAQQ